MVWSNKNVTRNNEPIIKRWNIQMIFYFFIAWFRDIVYTYVLIVSSTRTNNPRFGFVPINYWKLLSYWKNHNLFIIINSYSNHDTGINIYKFLKYDQRNFNGKIYLRKAFSYWYFNQAYICTSISVLFSKNVSDLINAQNY